MCRTSASHLWVHICCNRRGILLRTQCKVEATVLVSRRYRKDFTYRSSGRTSKGTLDIPTVKSAQLSLQSRCAPHIRIGQGMDPSGRSRRTRGIDQWVDPPNRRWLSSSEGLGVELLRQLGLGEDGGLAGRRRHLAEAYGEKRVRRGDWRRREPN